MNTTEPHVHTQDSGMGGMGFLMGIILLILFVFALLYYGLPMLRNATTTPAVTVPDQIDVNVNQPQGK